jgi:hypothetical protein
MKRILSLAVALVLALGLFPLIPAAVPQAEANLGPGGTLLGFPQQANFSYAVARVMPTNRMQAQMNQDVIDQFVKLIPEFYVDPDSATASNRDRFRMVLSLYGGTGPGLVAPVTTTETMGYGMMILAYMAGCENVISGGQTVSAHLRNNLPASLRNNFAVGEVTVRTYFNGMFRSLKHFRSRNINADGTLNWGDGGRRTYLMAWALNSGTTDPPPRPPVTAFTLTTGPNTATDGDMDMAYAMLVAEQTWGNAAGEQSPFYFNSTLGGNASTGSFTTYGYWARQMINDIWLVDVDRGQNGTPRYHLMIGNWVTGNNTLKTRPSDFMLQHLRAFAAVDNTLVGGVNRWQLVINATEAGIRSINNQNSGSGVLPDFVRVDRASGTWHRAAPDYHESEFDGDHWANACRVPWRLGTDMLIHGDRNNLHEHGVKRIHDTYIRLNRNYEATWTTIGPLAFNGTLLNNMTWGSVEYAAPAMVAASVYGTQARMNSAWEYCRTRSATADGRGFGAYINVLSMIAASGNWWCPVFSDIASPRIDPVVNWPAGLTAVFGQTLGDVTLPGNGSGTPGTFTWSMGNGTAVGAVGTRTHSVTFTPADINTYYPEIGSVNITVSRANPTVNWPSGLTATVGQTLANVTLPANNGSGTPGAFAWTNPANSVGTTPGTRSFNLRFTPTDTANFNTLTQSVIITVSSVLDPPSVNWPTGLTATFGQTLGNITLPGNGSGTPGAFSWTAGSGASVGNAGTRSHSLTFTPANTAQFSTVAQNVNVTVSRANPTVVWPSGLTAVAGQTLSNVTISGGSANTGGAFSWAAPSTSVGTAGVRSFTMNFTPSDTANFNPVSQNVSVTVSDQPAQTLPVTVNIVHIGTQVSQWRSPTTNALNPNDAAPSSFSGTAPSAALGEGIHHLMVNTNPSDHIYNTGWMIRIAVTTGAVSLNRSQKIGHFNTRDATAQEDLARLITRNSDNAVFVCWGAVPSGYTQAPNNTITLTPKPVIVYGDVNGDGVINSGDVTMLKYYIADSNRTTFGTRNPTFRIDNARVRDGVSDPNAADVSLLQLWIATPVPDRHTVKLGP